MDILHPAFVHYPIALLTLYSGLEIVSSVKKVHNLPYIFYTKTILVSLGSIAAFVARITGEHDAEILKGTPLERIADLHETWSFVATIIFLIIAFVYLLEWDKRDKVLHLRGITEISAVKTIHRVFYNQMLLSVLALLGFIALFITGILGGSMVHGPGADPMIRLFYSLFM